MDEEEFVDVYDDAKQARGLAIIIDVFRAFTVEPYLIYNAVEKNFLIIVKKIFFQKKIFIYV